MEAIKPLEPNHKGETCPHKPIICQEGYCSRCQIWKDRKQINNLADKEIRKRVINPVNNVDGWVGSLFRICQQPIYEATLQRDKVQNPCVSVGTNWQRVRAGVDVTLRADNKTLNVKSRV